MLIAPSRETDPTRVRLYGDEVKEHRNARSERWMYVGLLAVPAARREEALGLLQSDREGARCHSELHFGELRSGREADLAGRWLDRVMWDEPSGLFHFHVFGIRLDYLQRDAFGPEKNKQAQRIYARCFRMPVGYSLKAFFSPPVVVEEVVHDGGDLEHNPWFDWYSIARLQRDLPEVQFDVNRIRFVNSDHRKEPLAPADSHFVQLIDIVLGATRQCLDATSDNDYKVQLAKRFAPLVQRLTTPNLARNPNSRYRYRDRCQVSFFPKERLTLADLQDETRRNRPAFYSGRPLLLLQRTSGQESFSFNV